MNGNSVTAFVPESPFFGRELNPRPTHPRR
jgi:hypothetical protein